MTRGANGLLVSLLVLICVVAAAANGAATPGLALETDRAVPGTVWYQGFLADVDTGDPINATVEVVAELFDSAVDGAGLWGPETHSGVAVVEGWFNIELGSIESPLPDFSTPPYYLQLTINGEALDTRMKLASAPTAIRAGDVDGGGGGGIGGGGDAGYIPVFTSGDEISNSVILQTSGRISIDSSTSDAKLRVESAGGLPPVKIVNTSSGNVPSMLHIERTQEIAYGDDMLYMKAPSADYNANFIQCDLGTDKALETMFSVASDGNIQGSSIGLVSDSGPAVAATTTAANGSTWTVSAISHGSDMYGAAFNGMMADHSGLGYGGYFTGGLAGVSGNGLSDGTVSDCCGVEGYAYSSDVGSTYGIFATATGGVTSYGIYADSWGSAPTKWAGYFDGDVHSTGTITSAKSGFEIDHPADPENAYLRHAYVASPEMKTVTDGTILLDATGSATITMPDWFEALNSDVRYQLTPIGAAAPNLHIGSELSGGTFTIAGGVPGMKVCWLVTGVRKDRAALADPMTVESAKPLNERGKYVSPEAFGATKVMGVGHRDLAHPQRKH